MGKTLFIAEKPKVANEIMKSPRFRHSQKYTGSKPYYGYYENDHYIVSWCRGHLLELKNPEEMDPKYKVFSLEHLPLIYEPAYKVKQENAEQLQILVKLLQRPDVDHAVNICDADREGELIYREVYEFAGVNKKQSRVYKSSFEAAELERALNRLESASKYDGLAYSAKARQYLDYLLGMNITRGCTTKLAQNKFLLSSGRVQMCLLNEIRQRELAIENYREQSYYHLQLITDLGLKPVMKTEDPVLNPSPLRSLGEDLKGQYLVVEEFKEGTRKKNPKLLYNLTDLYKDAHAQLQINAETSRKHIQTLYEEGFITYPRSSSRHLPTEQVDRVKGVMQALAKSQYSFLVQSVDIEAIDVKHKTFNDELVSSHFAIIPTTKQYQEEGRPEIEKQLYSLVVKRFVGNFMRPAVYLVREVSLIDAMGNIYQTKESVLREKGFLEVFQEEVEEESVEVFKIPIMQKGQELQICDFELQESKTKKPALHTESSILTFMETAGRKIDDEHLKELMKGKRIGTVATEATFIPALHEKNYIAIEKGKITTTPIGRSFIEQFPVSQVKDPLYTAEMEGMIYRIEKNEMSYKEFIVQTNEFIQKITQEIIKIPDAVSYNLIENWKQQIEVCKCPCGNGIILDRGKFFGCSNHPNCNVGFPKRIKEKTIPAAQVKKLFEENKTDVIKGFKSNGKEFSAYLAFINGEVSFNLPTVEELSLGRCPKCQNGHILKRDTFFGCSDYQSGCNFAIFAKIKGKKLSDSQIKKLLKNRVTDFIHGFKGDYGEFTAAIRLKEDLRICFERPTTADRTVGKCPLCQSRVIIGKTNYLCEQYKKDCDFIISGMILEKKITANQIKKLLEKNMTDTIQGFKSKKTGELFGAKLTYDSAQKRLTFINEKKK
ncbi:DNA topoisomerase [Bacillus cereus group sp. Bce033]|uniref:type IA DNA topoisomerase n=1 Tax=Bacillus TaxID=1386 RepID=UPI0005A340E0|nr:MULTISPECIES: type IA DNA topoisomerase [Bacillus]COF12231.1 DNA topoisomerase III [Streptococcus pneumoniae]AJG56764.1 DNA topoisomerase family protein [Bacillus cereus D17]AYY25205.1 type IA DNA topoisomerase [Bacillus sp. FDAARGOS_527]KXY71787.1 DNA topoisomerase I [Bacillus cereus]MBL3848300.1 topoisomerase C-terminal repeat-containing protein [Bacillus cereus]